MKLRIDPELESLIPPLSADERKRLKESIEREGRILDPLKVWCSPEGHTLVDGHNRYNLYLMLGDKIPEPDYVVLPLPDIEAVKTWMRENQRGRRNLSPDQKLLSDLRSGLEAPAEFKTRQAKTLLEKAPELAQLVIDGTRTLTRAHNEYLRRTSPQPSRNTKPKSKVDKGRIHVVIGDTQVKPGVPTNHLTWIGRYIADQFIGQNVALIHLGDHWDMPSLSSYDQGKKAIEGRRYLEDVSAGNKGFALLNAPIEAAMKASRWKPERHFLLGNHEERILRACNDAAFLDGKLTLDDLDLCGWTRHDFLKPVILDGITYAHYFIAQNTGRPLGGENVETRLKTVGTSFTMGHQQGRKWAERQIANGQRLCGLVLGSTYLHDEDYRGPQGNTNWRGVVVCHQVEHGSYDPMFISLDYLCRRYEGQTLSEFMKTVVI